MRFLASLAAAAALVAPSVASPNSGPGSDVKTVPDGPHKLDDCGCWPIYQTMLKCQKLHAQDIDAIRSCACIPNPDGWYSSVDGCTECLATDTEGDDGFFVFLSQTINQLFVSCTNTGGGITADGQSICASNYYFQTCAALKTGDKDLSWASYVVTADFGNGKKGDAGNNSYLIDISEYQSGSASSSTSGSATDATSATSSAIPSGTAGVTTQDLTASAGASSATSVGSNSSVTSATGTGTSTASPAATKTPSSAMGYAGSRSQVGGIVCLVLAAGAAAVLL